MRIDMSEEDIQVAVHALRMAAERFMDNAHVASSAGHEQMASQFIKQATESEALAEQLEEIY
jgi:hypothetical protein